MRTEKQLLQESKQVTSQLCCSPTLSCRYILKYMEEGGAESMGVIYKENVGVDNWIVNIFGAISSAVGVKPC